jgi:hypothetical protein
MVELLLAHRLDLIQVDHGDTLQSLVGSNLYFARCAVGREVIGATSTVRSRPIAACRESTSTGRRWSGDPQV